MELKNLEAKKTDKAWEHSKHTKAKEIGECGGIKNEETGRKDSEIPKRHQLQKQVKADAEKNRILIFFRSLGMFVAN